MEQKKYNILLIEDDELDRMAFERFFKLNGLPHTRTIAGSVSEAKDLLDHEKFDAIISDYSLGDGTALDILNMVKNTPVILTTSLSDESVAIEAWKAGVYDYLPKDFNGDYLKTLPKAIENAIGRKKMEEALDRKQKNLEAIFDAAPVGMLLANEDKVITRVNDAIRQILHKDYPQIINRRIGDALACVNCAAELNECGQSPSCSGCLLETTVGIVLDSGKCVRNVLTRATLRIDSRDTFFWLRISAEPVIVDGRKHVVMAIDDFTESKKAEEELKETMELKSQFISTVSHELRTPLSAIKEGVAIVLDEVTGPINQEQRKFLDIARRNTDRLSALINNVLDFQKLGSNKAKLDIQSHDLEQVLCDVRETMALCAKKSDVELSFVCTEGLPRSNFDRDKIVQVLVNLVGNAIKFTPAKGLVCVDAKHHEGELAIAVSDTGMGIPQEALPKIFERFYRVNRPGKEIHGTGLGLAIVNRIVTMHGGRIEVESEIDRGTTFTVFLPADAKSSPEGSSAETDDILEDCIAE